VRTFSSIAVLAGLLLSTLGTAEAVTYSLVTLTVPVSVNAPMSGAGTYTVQISCSSPKTATFSGIGETVSLPISASSGRVTFGPTTTPVPLQPGLQSGATVTCTLALIPPPPVALQQYLNGLTYDSTKQKIQIVLP
jgi:hypothetical protein